MTEILNFFDTAVGARTLTSVHPPPGNQLLNTFRILLANENWHVALTRCDGKSVPPDFVEGLAREELHSRIQAICTDECGSAYSHFKQVGQMI